MRKALELEEGASYHYITLHTIVNGHTLGVHPSRISFIEESDNGKTTKVFFKGDDKYCIYTKDTFADLQRKVDEAKKRPQSTSCVSLNDLRRKKELARQ